MFACVCTYAITRWVMESARCYGNVHAAPNSFRTCVHTYMHVRVHTDREILKKPTRLAHLLTNIL